MSQRPAEQRSIDQPVHQMAETEPECRRRPRPWRRRRRPGRARSRQRPRPARPTPQPRCISHVVQAHAARAAQERGNPAISASETRFEIVIVRRSLAAANAISAGTAEDGQHRGSWDQAAWWLGRGRRSCETSRRNEQSKRRRGENSDNSRGKPASPQGGPAALQGGGASRKLPLSKPVTSN